MVKFIKLFFNLYVFFFIFFSELKTRLHDPNFQINHTDSKSSFIRRRKLGFVELTSMLINRIVKGLSIELSSFFNSVNPKQMCTKQALSKARKKLKYTAFVELNDLYVSSFYKTGNYQLYQGKYRLLAIDGSLCQLPDSKCISSYFGQWKNQTSQGMPMGRASIIYDVNNRVAINGCLASLEKSETELFRQQYAQLQTQQSLPFRSLYLMDRGYPSHDLCSMLDINGDYFVIRCKKDFCKAVKEFVDSSKQEDIIQLYPTVWYTKKGVKQASRYQDPISVKVVRVLLENGKDEYLLTNMHQIDLEELKYLYGLRWGVETYYDYLKDSMEIENFSSKLVAGVLQDFHACLLASNLVNMLINEAQQELNEKEKQTKYTYQINRKTATGILRHEVIKILFIEPDISTKLEQLKRQIKTSTTAIRPNRKFPRSKLMRSRRKFHMPKKKAL